jgi:uncharacterized repeat protein (TIGR03803 family)
VFSVTPGGAETVLHSFGGSGDGAGPQAGLLAVKGVLYGTTSAGGSGSCNTGVTGCGTIFSITTTGTEKVLHKFNGADGSYPLATLVTTGGLLYGTTLGGGSGSCSTNSISGCGTVFSVTKGGLETVLYNFAGAGDGSGPAAPLLLVNGAFYSTTEFGGTHNDGTVFSITP